MAQIAFDDFGMVRPPVTETQADIVAFGRRYDPRPPHICADSAGDMLTRERTIIAIEPPARDTAGHRESRPRVRTQRCEATTLHAAFPSA